MSLTNLSLSLANHSANFLFSVLYSSAKVSREVTYTSGTSGVGMLLAKLCLNPGIQYRSWQLMTNQIAIKPEKQRFANQWKAMSALIRSIVFIRYCSCIVCKGEGTCNINSTNNMRMSCNYNIFFESKGKGFCFTPRISHTPLAPCPAKTWYPEYFSTRLIILGSVCLMLYAERGEVRGIQLNPI